MYVLLNKRTSDYFKEENKYGVCIDTKDFEEAKIFGSLSLASYKEALLKESYEIIKL